MNFKKTFIGIGIIILLILFMCIISCKSNNTGETKIVGEKPKEDACCTTPTENFKLKPSEEFIRFQLDGGYVYAFTKDTSGKVFYIHRLTHTISELTLTETVEKQFFVQKPITLSNQVDTTSVLDY